MAHVSAEPHEPPPSVTSESVLAISLTWNAGSRIGHRLFPQLCGLSLSWSVIDPEGARGVVPIGDDPGRADATLDALGKLLADHHEELATVRTHECSAITCAGLRPTARAHARKTGISALAGGGITPQQVRDADDGVVFVVAQPDGQAAAARLREHFAAEHRGT